ncbi:MAG: hypothetical protein JXI32_09345 [Deltaproteobacteria bacterium]|nr:hypothetical protein [Deltaproteobacteria bacterium]
MKEEVVKLWDRIQRGMEAGFDAALSAVHAVTEKAGEGIELTRLRREKARLEMQVTRSLAALGNAVYEKIAAERLDDVAEKLEIKGMLTDIAEHEAHMANIDRRLSKELKESGKAEPGTGASRG